MLPKHVDDSSRKGRRREEEELLNKLLNKSTTITSFSVRTKDLPILETFREVAKREAGSRGFSEVLLKAMDEYNKRHELGNPQLKIESYVDVDKPKPMRVLCPHLDGALTSGEVHCRRKQMWISAVQCYSCDQNRLRKKK